MLIIGIVIAIVLIVTRVVTTTSHDTSQPANMQYMAMPNIPSGMFFRSRWMAVRSKEEEKVVNALGLKNTTRVAWRKGISVAAQRGLFVAPEVNDWTVVCGLGFVAPDNMNSIQGLKNLLVKLSTEFGEAHYYCSDTVAGLHCWMRAENGVITRVYSLNLGAGTRAYEEGFPTPAETPLLPAMELSVTSQVANGFPLPTREEVVMQVAEKWSTSFTGLGARLDTFNTFGWLGQPMP